MIYAEAQLLIPTGGVVDSYEVLELSNDTLRGAVGEGMAPFRIISHKSPVQQGASPLISFFDERTLQLTIERSNVGPGGQYAFYRNDLIDMLRPTRVFGTNASPPGTPVTPFKYRLYFDSVGRMSGSDAQVVNGGTVVTIPSAQFIHKGGLFEGSIINIEGLDFVIQTLYNDISFDIGFGYIGSTSNTAKWSYQAGFAERTLDMVPVQGPLFPTSVRDAGAGTPVIRESLAFRAYSPFWYGRTQRYVWTIESFGDLVFDGAGAIMSPATPARWMFASDVSTEILPVYYWGTHPASPRITVTGPAESVYILNATTNAAIRLERDVAAFETVVIDLRNLSAISSTGEDYLRYLTGPLSLFGITPDVPNRLNEMFVTFANGSSLSAITLEFENLYAGV